MHAPRTIALITAAATTIAASSFHPFGLKIRGTNELWARGDALLTAFQGCSDALDNGATPSVVHNSDGTISFIHYPAICAEEAEAYAPTGGETITVNGGIITVGNAPADFLATLHA